MVFDFSLGVSWRLILRRINLYARMALAKKDKKGGTPKIGGYNHPIYSLNPYILTATRPTGFLQQKSLRGVVWNVVLQHFFDGLLLGVLLLHP